ncbi:hypothetical protein TUM19329_33930 [Legionella antarctica]|uniref:Uncharacterized protein n=1 Tax=Legionella antarctica TaxID=2708020 RepID=A0A6F8TAE3_9GAMM|nr:hypothetical protein [Legionella antarctica]BCA97032.1 hypothetical protein TUM19329_33930 [Legionella antarctica]
MKIVISALHFTTRNKVSLKYFEKLDEYRLCTYDNTESPLKGEGEAACLTVQNFITNELNKFGKNEVTEVIILTDFNLGFSSTLICSNIPLLNDFMNSFQDEHGQQYKAQNKRTRDFNSPAAASAASPSFIPVSFYFEGAASDRDPHSQKPQNTIEEIIEQFGNEKQLKLTTYFSTIRNLAKGTPTPNRTPDSSKGILSSPPSRKTLSISSFKTDDAQSSSTPAFSSSATPARFSASASPPCRASSALGSGFVPSLPFFSAITPQDRTNSHYEFPKSDTLPTENGRRTLTNVNEELHPLNDGELGETIVNFTQALHIGEHTVNPLAIPARPNSFFDSGAEQERTSPPPSQLHRFNLLMKPVPTRHALSIEINDSRSALSNS